MHLLRTINRRYRSLPLGLRLVVIVLSFSVLMIIAQPVLIFPGALLSLIAPPHEGETLPPAVSSRVIKTADGQTLELWKRATERSSPIAVVFHGNGADLRNFFPFQQYFASLGITSFGFDYRGYGRSSGWPTERGLELDAQAVVEHIMRTESVEPDDLIIVGISVGTGPASYAAAKFRPRCLILFSPFTSLPDAIRARWDVGWLYPFAFYNFPVAKHVSELENGCVIVAHGKDDAVIPHSQGEAVYRAAKTPFSRFLSVSDAGHNDILYRGHDQVTAELERCLKTD